MKKLCTFPGCRTVVEHSNDGTSPRCTQHPVVQYVRKYEHHYDNKGKNIYNNPRWKKLSKAYRLLNPLCERCTKLGNTTLAQMVDHIVEIEDGGAMWDRNNLQALCNPCHNTKTGLEKRKRNKKSDYPKLSDF